MSQSDEIRLDLKRQSFKRLSQWLMDTKALYLVANLPIEEAVADVLYNLLLTAAGGIAITNLPKDEALDMLSSLIDRQKIIRGKRDAPDA